MIFAFERRGWSIVSGQGKHGPFGSGKGDFREWYSAKTAHVRRREL